MMPPQRSFDDVDEKERGQKKTDDLRAMTTLGPRTLHLLKVLLSKYFLFKFISFLMNFKLYIDYK